MRAEEKSLLCWTASIASVAVKLRSSIDIKARKMVALSGGRREATWKNKKTKKKNKKEEERRRWEKKKEMKSIKTSVPSGTLSYKLREVNLLTLVCSLVAPSFPDLGAKTTGPAGRLSLALSVWTSCGTPSGCWTVLSLLLSCSAPIILLRGST